MIISRNIFFSFPAYFLLQQHCKSSTIFGHAAVPVYDRQSLREHFYQCLECLPIHVEMFLPDSKKTSGLCSIFFPWSVFDAGTN